MMRTFALAALLLVTAAQAQSSARCSQQQELDKYQLLRRLSLDLRGEVPSFEEYTALDGQPTVPASTIAAWLRSDQFRLTARKYHEQLLWPNISNVRLSSNNAQTTLFGTFGAVGQSGKRNVYRGGPDVSSTALGAQCGDYEQTHFDPAFPGQFRPDPAFIQKTVDGGLQEGWRLVEPYWAPGTQVKVCAFDAQLTDSFVVGPRTIHCAQADGDSRKECGCGPNLRWCYPPSAAVPLSMQDTLREQLNRSVDEVTVGGRPYTDLLLSTKAWQNGPIVHWKKYLTPRFNFTLTYNVPAPNEQLAALAYTDQQWVKVDRGPLHAGVLTLPAYLLRFQTNRGRANRMRLAFECEQFVPPAQLPQGNGCSDSTDDLVNRCGCQYCHSTLEPLAARFGQFSEAGSALLTDAAFPDESAACKADPTSSYCRRFYVTEPTSHRFGWLLPLQFADVHPTLKTAYDEGPRARARAIISDGSFARCTVKRAFAHYVKRELRAEGAVNDEAPLLQELAEGFTQHEHSFPWLVEQLVNLPQYRRIH